MTAATALHARRRQVSGVRWTLVSRAVRVGSVHVWAPGGWPPLPRAADVAALAALAVGRLRARRLYRLKLDVRGGTARVVACERL